MNMLRPISRKYDRAEHEYPKELDMLAAMIDGISESGRDRRRRRGRRTPRARSPRTKTGQQERRQPRVRALHHGDVLGRRRPAALDAAPGPRQLRDRLGRQRRAARALRRHLGGDGDHRARHRLGLRATSTTTALKDGDEYVINGEKIYVTSGERADSVVVWATLDKSLGRAAIKSFVVAQGQPRHEGGAARAQARHPRLRHRGDHLRPTAASRPRTCSAPPRSTPSRASPARWRPSTTPVRWSPRWPSAAPGPRST